MSTVNGFRSRLDCRVGAYCLPTDSKPSSLIPSRINKSSGYKVLDQAAIRIVRLAAPFERFPESIKADTDILHITRTWTFTRGDQVIAE